MLAACFGQGTGPTLLSNLQCNGTESSLLSCSRSENNYYCGNAAGVECQCKLCTRINECTKVAILFPGKITCCGFSNRRNETENEKTVYIETCELTLHNFVTRVLTLHVTYRCLGLSRNRKQHNSVLQTVCFRILPQFIAFPLSFPGNRMAIFTHSLYYKFSLCCIISCTLIAKLIHLITGLLHLEFICRLPWHSSFDWWPHTRRR